MPSCPAISLTPIVLGLAGVFAAGLAGVDVLGMAASWVGVQPRYDAVGSNP
jgi:hypothetical protein